MDTRDLIIIAAKQEFMQHGYDAARMRSIAERAEINKGLLHYYFKSKEALLVEVFGETFSKLFLTIQNVTEKDGNLFDMIGKVVDVYIEFMMDNPQLPTFIIQELNRDPERHIQRMKKASFKFPFVGLDKAMNQAQEDGLVNPEVNSRHFILNLISMTLFPFVAAKMVGFMFKLNDKQYKQFLRERKKEITRTLIASIQA